MRSLLIHAWAIHKVDNQYYLPYTHWIYLEQMRVRFEQIVLVCPTVKSDKAKINGFKEVITFGQIQLVELPGRVGYAASIPIFFHYFLALLRHRKVDVAYFRFPVPFAWLGRILNVGRLKILHFVGDPADTVIKNNSSSFLKRRVMTTFFKAEELLTLWFAKKADKVFINGVTFSKKLDRMSVGYKSVISTTLQKDDFLSIQAPYREPGVGHSFMCLGYLNPGKNVKTLLKAVADYKKYDEHVHMHIVGDGPDKERLLDIVRSSNLENNVTFHGHLDCRRALQAIAQKCDLFWFASFSEGSPRVVIEAMAWGLPVVSTRVGSLPFYFEDGRNIIFVQNSYDAISHVSYEILSNPEKLQAIRVAAQSRVADLTIDKFIGSIFDDALLSIKESE